MAESITYRALPLFLTKKNKWPAALLMFVFAAAIYLTSNHFHLYAPRFIPMTWIDQHTPFVPYSVWIYVGEYLFFLSVFATCRDMQNLNKYLYSFVILQILSSLVFWLYPTTYPRDLFPLPSSLDRVTYGVFHALRVVDSPANCCPSLHVSSVYLSSFIFLEEQKEKFPFFLGWATAIAISTLTTKQHYLVDVVSGLGLAFLLYMIFHRWVKYRDYSSV